MADHVLPRRLFIDVHTTDDLSKEIFKAADATISIPQLADEESPLPEGWVISARALYDTTTSPLLLLQSAVHSLTHELPDFLKNRPEILEKVASITSLCDEYGSLLTPFTVLVVEQTAIDNRSRVVDPEAKEVFGDPGVTPTGLTTLNLDGVAAYMRSGQCRSVMVLTGAGVSTSSGIPDYRSEGGLYKTLNPELLTTSPDERNRLIEDPPYLAHIDLFQQNPWPLLEAKRELLVGIKAEKWRPTAAHYFCRVLKEKGLLAGIVTQNVDGLHHRSLYEKKTEKKKEKEEKEEKDLSHFYVEAHGSLTNDAVCTGCGDTMGFAEFVDKVEAQVKDVYSYSGGQEKEKKAKEAKEYRNCGIECASKCEAGSMKPGVVLFGEPINPAATTVDYSEVDLLIIAGTSLTVPPISSLPSKVKKDCVRLVVNGTRVGDSQGLVFDSSGSRRDVLALGDIDSTFVQLSQKLGWLEDLAKFHHHMPPSSQELIDRAPHLHSKNEVATQSAEGAKSRGFSCLCSRR